MTNLYYSTTSTLFFVEDGYVANDYVIPSPVSYYLETELAVGSYTDVTSYMVRGTWTRTTATLFDPPTPDTGLFELLDSVGNLAPYRGSALKPGRLLRMRATKDATWYPMFTGRITSVRNQPTVGANQNVVLEVQNDLKRVLDKTITTSLFQNINIGSLYTEVMTLTNASSFRADALDENVEFAWFRGRDAASILGDLIRAGNFYSFVDGAGTLNLKRANWAFNQLGIYVDTGYMDESYVNSIEVITAQFYDLAVNLNDSRIINDLKVNMTPKKVSTSIDTIAIIPSAISLPASSHTGFWLTYQDPEKGGAPTAVASFITQASSQDFYAAANSDGTGTNLTANLSLNMTRFGETAVCSIFNGGGTDAWLTRFQIRGYAVREESRIGFQVENNSSQNVYGRRALEFDTLIQNRSYVQSLATSVVSQHKEAQPDLEVTWINEWPLIFARELGDQVSIVESVTGVNSVWAVFQMTHELDLVDGIRHQAQFQLRFF